MWLVLEPSLPVATRSVPKLILRSALAEQNQEDEANQHRAAAKAEPNPIAMSATDVPAPIVTKRPASEEFDSPAQRRREQVLALIHYPWEKLGYEVVFLDARPGYRAMTISDKKRIEVYARPGDDAQLLAFDLAHELGHAYDLEHNDGARRDRWRQMRGIDASVPWFGCNRCPDYQTPAGDFAETFALLLLGPQNYHSRIALPPTREEIPLLAEFCGIDVDY